MSDSLWPYGPQTFPPDSSGHGILQTRILSGSPCPSPWHLPDPGIEPVPPTLAGRFFTTEPPGKPNQNMASYYELINHAKISGTVNFMYFKLRFSSPIQVFILRKWKAPTLYTNSIATNLENNRLCWSNKYYSSYCCCYYYAQVLCSMWTISIVISSSNKEISGKSNQEIRSFQQWVDITNYNGSKWTENGCSFGDGWGVFWGKRIKDSFLKMVVVFAV